MLKKFAWKRDYYAGGLMLLIGVGAAVTGTGYKFGTLARMGPGFMPVVLGVVLAFLGLLIAGTALGSSEPDDKKFLPDNPQWFGWLCILGGPVLFIIIGQYGGMIPAVFACVFVCALGDKTATYKSSAVLAFLGLLIAGTALASSEPDDKKFLPDNPQWFGWLCILGGPILFIILGQYGGMIPAVFACVFVCALGDKTGTYKSSAILAAGVTVFGVLLFHYLLSIPFPLIRGVNL